MCILSNTKDFRLWAKREQIYVDGEAFVRARIHICFYHPVLRLKIEQKFGIDEPLSDVQLELRMNWDGLVLTSYHSKVDLLLSIFIYSHKNHGSNQHLWRRPQAVQAICVGLHRNFCAQVVLVLFLEMKSFGGGV